jgi:two-component system phosphate regulon sensor histidine kinase PhoR
MMLVALLPTVLVLCFCGSSVTGYILTSIFINRGASLARMQNDFLSSVSHELRTPLTSIRMFIETLREDRVTDPVERRKCLNVLHQEITRLDGLVSKLIHLSKIESGREVFTRLPTDVQGIVDDALASFEAIRLGPEVARAEGQVEVQLAVEVAPGLRVIGDRAALSQALLNLLTNAYKYATPSAPTVVISARNAGPRSVEIAVIDRGPGIPAEEQERIFESFERGRAAVDSRMAGVGLGLATVRAIVQAHGGEVDLVSRPGTGSIFRLRLPRVLPT